MCPFDRVRMEVRMKKAVYIVIVILAALFVFQYFAFGIICIPPEIGRVAGQDILGALGNRFGGNYVFFRLGTGYKRIMSYNMLYGTAAEYTASLSSPIFPKQFDDNVRVIQDRVMFRLPYNEKTWEKVRLKWWVGEY